VFLLLLLLLLLLISQRCVIFFIYGTKTTTSFEESRSTVLYYVIFVRPGWRLGNISTHGFFFSVVFSPWCVREKTKKNGVFGLGFVFCNTSSATVAKSFLRSSIHIYYVLILLNWQHKVSRRRSRNEHDNTRSITPVHTFIHGQ